VINIQQYFARIGPPSCGLTLKTSSQQFGSWS